MSIIESNHFDSLLDDDEPIVQETPAVENDPAEPVEGSEIDPADTTSGADDFTESNDDNMTALESFLNAYGVKEGKYIIMEDEEGQQTEVDFNSLSKEEQLSVLKELTSPGLTEEEINTINHLRRTNSTLQDVMEAYAQQAIQKYIADNGSQRSYSIDEYDDDTLFVADLKSRYADLTDEELQEELVAAKTNETLFKKKVDAIRTQYKTLEDQQAEERAQEEQQRFEDAKNQVASALQKFDTIKLDHTDDQSYGLTIEDSEREAVMKYITERDAEGTSQFFKDLNDPETLVRLAWFNKFGQDAITGITQFWKSQLREARKTSPVTKPVSKTTIVPKEDTPKSKEKTLSNLYDELM